MSFVHVMYRCESEGFRLRIPKLLVPAQPQEVVTTGERSFLRMISLISFHVSKGKSSSFKTRTWRSLSVSLNGWSTSELPTAMVCAVSSWDEAAVVRGLTCQFCSVLPIPSLQKGWSLRCFNSMFRSRKSLPKRRTPQNHCWCFLSHFCRRP